MISTRSKTIITVLFAVVVVVGVFIYARSRKPAVAPPPSGKSAVQPTITNFSRLGEAPPSLLKDMLPRQTLESQGATVRQSELRTISNGQQQSVFVYSSKSSLAALRDYFKNYFAKNKISIGQNSIGDNQFVLSGSDGKASYAVFVIKDAGGGSLVNVSVVK